MKKKISLLWYQDWVNIGPTVQLNLITVVESPISLGTPAGGECKVGHFEGLFSVVPLQKRRLLSFPSDLDDIVFESDPETAIFIECHDARCLLFSFVGFSLVESDGRLGVFPSADEHFDHGLGDRIAAKQRNVGVVMAPDIES